MKNIQMRDLLSSKWLNRHAIKACFVLVLLITLSACGGGGAGDGDDDGVITGTGFSGKAAIGVAIANADITIKSLSGVTISTQSDADGNFSSSELKEATATTAHGPYLLRVHQGGNHYLYSVAHSENASTIDSDSVAIAVNIHPYTDLIIRNWFAIQGLDIDSAFSSGAITSLPTADEIDAISSEFLAIITEALDANGAPTNIDLLSSPFEIGDGFDSFLDNSTVVINNQINIVINQQNAVNAIQTTIINNIDIDTDFTSGDDNLPSPPHNLRALAAGAGEVVVVWDPSSDDKGVAGYNVYRDGVLVSTTPFPIFNDSGLSTGVNYHYIVEAFDGHGQISESLAPVSVDITLDAPDTTASPAATSLQASEVGSAIVLSWNISNINDVSGFRVYRGAAGSVNTMATSLATVTSTSMTDFNVSPGASYCYRIVTFDAAGNDSPASDETCITLSGDISNPSSIAFSAATYTIQEGMGAATITVNRIGDLSEAISVEFAATALTATAGVDFVETSGTLNWAAADSSAKTFSIQINENSEVEMDETVQLTLSNPSINSSLGTEASAELTITDASQVTCIDLSPTEITTNTTLSEPCYNVDSNVNVSNAATLTINPGVRLVFAADVGFTIEDDGVLMAIGSQQQPIVFTGALAAPGYWNGITINSIAPSQFDYATIEYGGNITYNDANIVVASSGKLSVLNTIIRHSNGHGVSVGISGTLTAFSGNTVTLNEDSPIYIPATQAGVLAKDNSFSGNVTTIAGDKDYIELVSTYGVVSNQTWNLHDVDYHLTGKTDVDAELTLAPGVTLTFPADAQLYVSDTGTLKAIGTELEPITFTGLLKTPGFWKGIQFTFNHTDNVMDHTIVEYGGGSSNSNANVGVFGQDGKLTISNSILRYSLANGFSFYSGIDLSMSNVTSTENNQPGRVDINDIGLLDSNSTYSGNSDDRVFIESTSLSDNQTIHHLDVPYFFTATMDVTVNAALTIEPGTEIQFNADGGLNVSDTGTLVANGTAQEPITFTGVQKTKGYWTGIQHTFSNNGNSIDHAIIEYAGAPSGNVYALVGFFGSGSLACTGNVTNTLLRGSQNHGISIESDTTGDFVTGNTFEDIDGEEVYTGQ
jgi:hypothetical protein